MMRLVSLDVDQNHDGGISNLMNFSDGFQIPKLLFDLIIGLSIGKCAYVLCLTAKFHAFAVSISRVPILCTHET